MKRLALLIASLSLAIAVTGCPGQYSADGFCDHLVDLQCQYYFKCCNAAERAEQLGSMMLYFGFRNEDECKTEYRKHLCPQFQVYSEAVAQGRATWKDDVAKSCYEHMEKGVSECDAAEYSKEVDGCDLRGDIMQGKVANGSTCFIDAECTDLEAECEEKKSEDPNKVLITVEGTCKAPPRDGEACTPGGDCADGHYCDSTDICRVQKPAGQSCTNAEECESWDCDWTNSVCNPKQPNGGTCYRDEQCESGHCDGNTCGTGTSTDDNYTYQICDGNPFSLFGMTFALPVSMPVPLP
ncbi:MAG: hypothetical protein JXR83_18665 [Deltaproteobacteria bacterium]|nr:hypothetical protein [Deltaproteobacteria bacterium]